MKAIWMSLALMAASLAGCTGEDEPIGVSRNEDGSYTFVANVDAESYAWDFGDRIGRGEGRVASYAYDFDTGSVTVRLSTMQDGQRETHTHTLVVGEGENTPPALVLEAGTDWAVVGETVRFSATASTDPEGDPLRLTWSCFVKQEELVVHDDHSHAGGGGLPFSSPGSGSGAARVAAAALPEPDRTVEGDLCEGLQTGGPGRDATIEGAFTDDGLYAITLIGSDGPNPTISTSFDIYVSAPELRPAPSATWTFDGQLAAGSGGSLQEFCAQLEQGCDEATHPLVLDFVAKNFTAELTATAATGSVSYILLRGENIFVDPQGEAEIHQQSVKPGNYRFQVNLQQGARASYEIVAEAEWDRDPRTYFD